MKLSRHVLILCLVLLFLYLTTQFRSGVDKHEGASTHHLHHFTMGSGSPTVVLDVGIGESYVDWLPLLEKIALTTSVFCYDRAGYGQSEMGPLPRTSERAADELDELLHNSGIKAPYLLLGHSLGALNLQVFADKYPDHVAGMVLLDPPPLKWISGHGFPELYEMAQQQTRAFEAAIEAAQQSQDKKDNKEIYHLLTLSSEHKELFLSSAQQASAITLLKPIPLFVIASGRPNPAFGEQAEAFQKFWNEQCEKLAEKSINGKYLLASESSHFIHRDAPDLVLDTVNELIKKSRGR